MGYGKGKKPIISVIDVAAQWLRQNNINVQSHEESKPEQHFWAPFRNGETFMRADEAKKAALLAA